MAIVEERLSYLEGRVNEHFKNFGELRNAVRHLEQRMDARFDAMDQRVNQHFTWLVGLHVTTLIAIVGALLARA